MGFSQSREMNNDREWWSSRLEFRYKKGDRGTCIVLCRQGEEDLVLLIYKRKWLICKKPKLLCMRDTTKRRLKTYSGRNELSSKMIPRMDSLWRLQKSPKEETAWPFFQKPPKSMAPLMLGVWCTHWEQISLTRFKSIRKHWNSLTLPGGNSIFRNYCKSKR